MAANGTISADARITGTSARPDGTVRLNARGVQLKSGPGRAIPPANLTAQAALSGGVARIDARLTAGSSNLTLAGTAPVTAGGALDLRATGVADLAMIEPLLAASGRRVAGRVNLDARITGTRPRRALRAPRSSPAARCRTIASASTCERLPPPCRRTASTSGSPGSPPRPGPGTIGGSGTIGLAAPMPVDLTFTAQNATPVANDMLTARLDANLTIAGEAAGQSDGAGHGAGAPGGPADPGQLPQSVAVLPVRNPECAAADRRRRRRRLPRSA